MNERLYGEAGFTQDAKVRELIEPFIHSGMTSRMAMFAGMDGDTATLLLALLPEGQAQERQNDAPTFEELVDLAGMFQGTVGGYVIQPPRVDERVTIDTLIVPEIFAEQVEEKLAEMDVKPDENDSEGDYRRFWWD